MWIPGFGSDEIRPYKKACTTEAHKQVRYCTHCFVYIKAADIILLQLCKLGSHSKYSTFS